MTTVGILGRALGAVLLGGMALTGPAVVPGTAHADVWGNHEWCPGSPMPSSDNPISWDMNVCHNWFYASKQDDIGGAPWSNHFLIEGVRPNPCPPFAFMCP